MALTSVIGALRVVLGADTAAFESGLKSAEKSLGKFNANLGKIGIGVGAALAGAAAALGASIKSALNQAEQLNKMSQVLGVSTEELSALKHIADLADVSFETLSKGISRLNRNIYDVAAGAKGPAAEGFKALGINVRNADGTLKSGTETLAEIGGKLSGMADGSAKAGLAMRLLGKGGAELISVLNLTKAEIQAMTKEAEDLGLIISTRTAKAADSFNDNLSKLRKGLEAIGLKVTAELAPAMAVLLERFVEWVKTGNVATTAAGFIIEAFASIELAVRNLITVFRNAGGEILAFGKLALNAATLNIYGAVRAFEDLKTRGAETDRQFAENRQIYLGFKDRIAALAAEFDTLTKMAGRAPPPIAATKNALDQFIKSTEKSLAAQKAEVDALGKSFGEKERLKIQYQADAIAKEENIKITDALTARIAALGNTAAETALKLQAGKLIEESVPAWQRYRIEVAEVQTGLQLLGKDAETTQRVMTLMAEKAGQAWNIALGQITGDFATAFKEFAKNNKALGIVSKAFAISQALINTYTAVTKALALYGPTPLGYAGAAAALALGLAQVVKIKAEKFATGGAMRMSKFADGQDSQLLTARVRPDEQVDIWRPGEGPDPRRGAGGMAREVVIRVDEISRATVEKLIPALNSAFGDGYKLKMVN